jgi:hypothetical protein
MLGQVGELGWLDELAMEGRCLLKSTDFAAQNNNVKTILFNKQYPSATKPPYQPSCSQNTLLLLGLGTAWKGTE